jgi:hypothetical protein
MQWRVQKYVRRWSSMVWQSAAVAKLVAAPQSLARVSKLRGIGEGNHRQS